MRVAGWLLSFGGIAPLPVANGRLLEPEYRPFETFSASDRCSSGCTMDSARDPQLYCEIEGSDSEA